MLRKIGPLAAAVLLACERSAPAAVEAGPRELGRVEVIYPHLASSGSYVLEYQLTSDTVFVDYLEAKALAEADPLWKEALTTRDHIFYDDGENCMSTPAVAGCLRFRDEPPIP